MSRERMVQDMPTKLGAVDTQQKAGQQTDETMILDSREALMTVEQVIERTKEWVSMKVE